MGELVEKYLEEAAHWDALLEDEPPDGCGAYDAVRVLAAEVRRLRGELAARPDPSIRVGSVSVDHVSALVKAARAGAWDCASSMSTDVYEALSAALKPFEEE